VPPDSLPPEDNEETTPDGRIAQHPVHDSDQEDRDPEAYEQDIDRDGDLPVDRVVRRNS